MEPTDNNEEDLELFFQIVDEMRAETTPLHKQLADKFVNTMQNQETAKLLNNFNQIKKDFK